MLCPENVISPSPPVYLPHCPPPSRVSLTPLGFRGRLRHLDRHRRLRMPNARLVNGGLVVPYSQSAVIGSKGGKLVTRQRPRRRRARKGGARRKPRATTRPENRSAFRNGPRDVLALRESSDELCAMLNPFCPAAKGRKHPDGLNTNSLTYQFRGRLPAPTFVNTHSLSGFKIKIAPFCPYGYVQCTDDGTGKWLTSGGSTLLPGTHTLFVNNANAFRVVSAGIIVRCVANTTNAQGYLIIGKSNGLNLGGTEAAGDDVYMETQTVPVYAGLECAVLHKPVGVTAFEFNPQGINTGSYDVSYWDTVSIEATGITVNTTLDIQFVYNIEFTCQSDNDITQLAPPDPPKRAALVDATNYVRQKLASVFEKGDMVLDAAVRAGADRLGAAVLSRIAGRAAPLALAM
jgi:hypothetical protein